MVVVRRGVRPILVAAWGEPGAEGRGVGVPVELQTAGWIPWGPGAAGVPGRFAPDSRVVGRLRRAASRHSWGTPHSCRSGGGSVLAGGHRPDSAEILPRGPRPDG